MNSITETLHSITNLLFVLIHCMTMMNTLGEIGHDDVIELLADTSCDGDGNGERGSGEEMMNTEPTVIVVNNSNESSDGKRGRHLVK